MMPLSIHNLCGFPFLYQIDMLLRRRPELLVLAKHYGPTKFARHALRFMDSVKAEEDKPANVVIIGGGLAGLTAALTILDRYHGTVLM